MAAYTVNQDFVFTVERGTTWGTKVQSAAIGLPTEDLKFNIEPNAHRINRANGVRGQHENASWNDTFGKVPTASTSIIWTPQLLALLMPGLLQKSTNWTPVGNVYTMYTNNYAALPSPKKNNDGYFYTLTRNSPEANKDEMIASALISSAKLSIHPTDKEGVLSGDVEFVGTGLERGQQSTATVTHASLDNMFKWGIISAVTFGSSTLTSDFISAEFNITNGAKLAQDLPSGEVVFPRWEVTGTIKVIANSLTEALKTKVLNNNVNQAELLTIQFGEESELTIKSLCYLNSFSSDFTEGEVIEFTFEGVFDDAGGYPFQIEFGYA